MDAISMLKDDHKTVERLFKRFERAGDGAHLEKREVVDRIVEELSKHAAVEEQLFYPVARATVPGTDGVALESLEEHHIVKWSLSELEGMDPHDERFDAKVTVLIEHVRHHVKEEEQDYFPKVRDELGRNALADLGDAMMAAKKVAPTHPHPRSPDAPPGNLMVGAAAGVVDRLGDTVSGLAQGSVTAVGDVVALVLRRKKPRVSPSGSRVARRTAGEVRSGAASVTDAAIEAVRDAKRTGEATVKRTGRTAKRTAKGGARGATTTARKSLKRTATTTKRAPTTTGRARAAAKNTAAIAKRARRSGSQAGARSVARSGRDGVRSTGRAGKSGVKGATARSSARRTSTTAKRATPGRTARAAARKTAKRTVRAG